VGRILEDVLGNVKKGDLPAMMRINFDGRPGWITFEERTPNRIIASYHLEMPAPALTVPGEYGTVADPNSKTPIGETVFGTMELIREGTSLSGFFNQNVDMDKKGELVLQFSPNMQSFTGKWRKEGDHNWNENLNGSSN
jgi:hypothetical protein